MRKPIIDEMRPTSAEALERLKRGNERFLAGHARFPTVQKDILADLRERPASLRNDPGV